MPIRFKTHTFYKETMYENKICSRCTRKAYCICFGDLHYCDACFESVMNDPDSKIIMENLLRNYGTN